MSTITALTVKEVDRIRYRPSKAAEEFLADLRSALGLTDKATAARLAIARSTTEPTEELPVILDTVQALEKGMPIEGVHLFGEDGDLWACVVCASIEQVIETTTDFRALVEYHWHRGALLLQKDYVAANKNMVDLIVHLAGSVPSAAGVGGMPKPLQSGTDYVSEAVRISILREADSWPVNAAGGNGLMVISGKPGSGKSQLALDLLSQAAKQGVRFLFFDLKGELEDSADNSEQREKRNHFLSETNAQYIRLIDAGLPINPFLTGANQPETAQIASEIAHLVRCFASQLGPNQERTIREAYEDLRNPDVHGLVEALESRGEAGVALSIIGKIDSFRIFSRHDVAQPVEKWLSRSTIIDFKGLGNDNETKSLVVAFVLNTIMRQLNRQLPVINGVQPLQMILFVDEAHLLLPKEGKAGLLGSLARQGRSWGFPVWLASQDADSFITKGQHATDFAQLSDCGIHLSPGVLTDAQQRQILGQVVHRKLNSGEGVLRLRGATVIGGIRQYWRDKGLA